MDGWMDVSFLLLPSYCPLFLKRHRQFIDTRVTSGCMLSCWKIVPGCCLRRGLRISLMSLVSSGSSESIPEVTEVRPYGYPHHDARSSTNVSLNNPGRTGTGEGRGPYTQTMDIHGTAEPRFITVHYLCLDNRCRCHGGFVILGAK